MSHFPDHPLRWLLVAQDDWGLGHVSRHIGLGRAIRRRRPGDEILVLTYSEVSYLFWREGLATFKLPAPKRSNTRTLSALKTESQIWLTRAGVNSVLDAFRPHVIVTDTYPTGVRREFPGLLHAQALRCFIAQDNRFLATAATQRDIARYHLVLALQRPDEATLTLPPGPRVEWVGHILVRRPSEALPRQAARRKLGLPDEGPVCLVGLGGGGSPQYEAMTRWIADAAAAHPTWTFAFAEAPLLWEPLVLPPTGNLRLIRHYPLAECLNAFDLSVMVNGSSVNEVSHFGLPAIIMPNPHAVAGDEVAERARRIAEATGGRAIGAWDDDGLHAALRYFDDAANRVLARERLATWRKARGGDDHDGGVKAVTAMLQALRQLSARVRRSETD